MIRNPSSFRDRSGFVFSQDDKVYRWVSPEFSATFSEFSKSSLYEDLTRRGWLIPHLPSNTKHSSDLMLEGAQIVEPEQLEMISYPYEWSFTQLKESAILTLDVCLDALKKGYILKDASAYNVQLLRGQPTFIDSLSFVKYEENQSWIPYRQFINHFLNPLLLMAKVDPHLNNLLRIYLDGIPSQLTAQMLPWQALWNPIVFMNVRMHAKLEKRYESKPVAVDAKIPTRSLENMLQALKQYIATLTVKADATEWAQYYSNTNYNELAFRDKSNLVINLLRSIKPHFNRILDLGGNDGTFSRQIAGMAEVVICADIDPLAVEANYQKNRTEQLRNIYPLRLDFTNPSPSVGWNCKERDSFFHRAKSDVVISLAFIHHMVIGQNISFEMVAASLVNLGDYLIIEFVGPNDSQVKRLMATRQPNHVYNEEEFEKAFLNVYSIQEKHPIQQTERVLYLLKKRT